MISKNIFRREPLLSILDSIDRQIQDWVLLQHYNRLRKDDFTIGSTFIGLWDTKALFYYIEWEQNVVGRGPRGWKNLIVVNQGGNCVFSLLVLRISNSLLWFHPPGCLLPLFLSVCLVLLVSRMPMISWRSRDETDSFFVRYYKDGRISVKRYIRVNFSLPWDNFLCRFFSFLE